MVGGVVVPSTRVLLMKVWSYSLVDGQTSVAIVDGYFRWLRARPETALSLAPVFFCGVVPSLAADKILYWRSLMF